MSTNGIDIENQKNETSCDKCMTILVITLLYFLGIGLLGACVSYYVFGIIYLVSYKNKNDDCDSLIWSYVLITLVTNIVLGILFLNLKLEDDILKLIKDSISGLISIGFGTWGLYLCLNENCDALKDTPLYTYAFVTSLLQLITIGILFLYYTYLLCK